MSEVNVEHELWTTFVRIEAGTKVVQRSFDVQLFFLETGLRKELRKPKDSIIYIYVCV